MFGWPDLEHAESDWQAEHIGAFLSPSTPLVSFHTPNRSLDHRFPINLVGLRGRSFPRAERERSGLRTGPDDDENLWVSADQFFISICMCIPSLMSNEVQLGRN